MKMLGLVLMIILNSSRYRNNNPHNKQLKRFKICKFLLLLGLYLLFPKHTMLLKSINCQERTTFLLLVEEAQNKTTINLY